MSDGFIRALVGITAVGMSLAIVEFANDDIALSQVKIECIEPTERLKIREIVLQGIDEGLKLKVEDLFESWVRDPTEQPKRAQTGLTNAIGAHIRARDGALRWMPPPCEGVKQ